MFSRIHYSWFICLGCTLALFCTGGLCITGFSVYLPFFRSELGFSNTAVSVIVFARSLSGVIGMMFVERFMKRFEIRIVVTGAMLIGVLGFTVFAFAGNVPLCIAAAVICGTAYGFGSMIPVSILISRWFNEHSGLALGICMAATGASAFIASPIITFMVEHWSLRTSFLAEAAFIFVVSSAVWNLLRSMPSCLDLEPLGDRSDNRIAYAEATASSKKLTLLAAGFLMLGTASNNVHTNLPLLYQSVGFGSDAIANVVAFFGISLAVGKCVSGIVIDRIGPFKSCMILFVISAAGCLLCCLAPLTGLTTANTAVILIGFGMSVASIGPTSFAARVSAEEDYPGVLSRFQTFHTLGGLIFATIPGIIADLSDSYVISYIIMLAAIVISAAVLQGVYHRIVCENRP